MQQPPPAQRQQPENNDPNLRWLHFALIIVSFILLIVCFVSNAFVNTSASYKNMDVQPADFCYYTIWAIMYLFQIFFLVYSLIYLFRRDPNKNLLFTKINHVHFSCFILAIISYMADISWSWSAFSTIGNFVTLVVMAAAQWAIVIISMYSLKKRLEHMKAINMRTDVVLTRLLIQNGCAIFATWTTIHVIMGFASLLTNNGGVDGIAMSTMALSIILGLLILYFVAEFVIFTQHCLFQYTTYLTVVWAYVGILAKNLASTTALTRNNIIAIVTLSIGLALLFIKLIIPLICFDKIKPPSESRAPSKLTGRERTNVSMRSREKTGVWHY